MGSDPAHVGYELSAAQATAAMSACRSFGLTAAGDGFPPENDFPATVHQRLLCALCQPFRWPASSSRSGHCWASTHGRGCADTNHRSCGMQGGSFPLSDHEKSNWRTSSIVERRCGTICGLSRWVGKTGFPVIITAPPKDTGAVRTGAWGTKLMPAMR